MNIPSVTPLHQTHFVPEPWPSQMLQLTIVLSGQPDRILLMENDVKEEPFYQLICLRLETLGIVTTTALRLYLTVMLENPGEVSIYAHSLWHLYMDKGGNIPLTLNDFLTAYGDGFPSEEHLDKFWDGQKTADGNNLLDMKSLYQRAG